MKGRKPVSLIVVLAAAGAAFAGLAWIAQGGEPVGKLFLVFLGAVIVIQVVPAFLLLGGLVKGIFGWGAESEETLRDSGAPYELNLPAGSKETGKP